MKSVFDQSVREELVNRINSVTEQSRAQWGKMNAFQMLQHCTLCEDMFLGKIRIKRVFIGRLIGPVILKKVLKDDKPFGKNSPTSKVLRVPAPGGNLETQKREWIGRVEEYARYCNEHFIHPFFGPMTPEQVGHFAYKHADHHLRQFGA